MHIAGGGIHACFEVYPAPIPTGIVDLRGEEKPKLMRTPSMFNQLLTKFQLIVDEISENRNSSRTVASP